MIKMADADLELDSERASANLTHQMVRKKISLKLKPKSEGKSKKKDKVHKKKNEKKSNNEGDKEGKKKKLSNAETKSASTKPTNELNWNQQLLIIGQKVQDPLLHQCEKCALPILIYGRMNPCKHTFCLECAEKASGKCPRCGDLVQRIEKAKLGHVFVCSFGGSRYGISGCRRSYLSQRDLHAHIKRRHQGAASSAASDLSAEYAADLKRSEMSPYPNRLPSAVPIMHEQLPPQPERNFQGRLPLIADRAIHAGVPLEAYQPRPPTANFPPTSGVVSHMANPTGPPRIIQGDPTLVRARFEDISRNAIPVGQPQVCYTGQEAEIRPGWLPGHREITHPMRGEGGWMPPRSDPGVPLGLRHERPPFIRGTTPFY